MCLRSLSRSWVISWDEMWALNQNDWGSTNGFFLLEMKARSKAFMTRPCD